MSAYKSIALLGAVLCFLLAAPTFAAPVRVVPAGASAIRRAIAERRGRVVLVNMWATWCGPCVAELPGLAALSRRYRGRGLAVMGVSLDSERLRHTRVEPLLASKGVGYPVYLSSEPDPERFIRAFGGGWQGDLPQTFLYDRRGRLVRTLAQSQTVHELELAVLPYLKR